MKILTTKPQLQKAVKSLYPSRIAVAYIGAGWRKYIPSPENLSDLIVSPTLGSNPKAIHEIANIIGWEKVHFLDKLHAKIYLASDKAMIGSANLSDNAFAEDNLEEVMVLIKKKKLSRNLIKK